MEEQARKVLIEKAERTHRLSPEELAALLADADRLTGGGEPASLDTYIPLIYETPATLFDYAADALTVVSSV